MGDYMDTILTKGSGAQPGFLTPMDAYGGLYDNAAATQGMTDYYKAQQASYGQENAQLDTQIRNKIFGRLDIVEAGDWDNAVKSGAVTFDPATGLPVVNPNTPLGAKAGAILDKFKSNGYLDDPELTRMVAAKQNLQQRQASTESERAQALQGQTGFRQEMNRFTQNMQAPNLMASYVAPGLQQAGQAALGTANAAGGGSLGQAAARRSAFNQFGQAAAGVVPQAVAKQGELDTIMKQQYEKQRAGMIQSNFQNQMAASQQRYDQNMRQQAYEKALEEWQHSRSMESLKIVSDLGQGLAKTAINVGGLATGQGAGA